MLSRNKSKLFISLRKKKYRDEEGLFIIEGDKIVREFLQSEIRFEILVAKPEFISTLSNGQLGIAGEIIPVSYEELKKVSSLKTPHNAVAVVKMFRNHGGIKVKPHELVVALDAIRDPGNLGTIIRAAAWFGIRNIICSETCVDVYNPKVIQATMGAIARVDVGYTGLHDYLELALREKIKVYGSLLEGESVYDSELGKSGIILLGNESRGISGELMPFVTHKITIPRFVVSQHEIDSLNAGMAASIIFSEFRRRKLSQKAG